MSIAVVFILYFSIEKDPLSLGHWCVSRTIYMSTLLKLSILFGRRLMSHYAYSVCTEQ